MNGQELILKERERQQNEEGYTTTHDECYKGNIQLLTAAKCYYKNDETEWPWRMEFWKPTPNDRIRQLVKAGALAKANNELNLCHESWDLYRACIKEINQIQKNHEYN